MKTCQRTILVNLCKYQSLDDYVTPTRFGVHGNLCIESMLFLLVSVCVGI